LTAPIEGYPFFASGFSCTFEAGPSGISPFDGSPFPVFFYPLREFLAGQTFQTPSDLFSAASAFCRSVFQPLDWTTVVPALDVSAGNC
jgi:hypothetical protein